jgi:hypothetical protein
MNTHTTLTELDAAIIAEEQGWEYLPACDEAELLLAEAEEIKVAASAQPNSDIVIDPFLNLTAPKVNKRSLRARLIRDTMDCVRSEEDDQSIGWHMINDDRWLPLFAGKDDDQVHDYVYGVIRFCERALRYNQ